MLIRPARTVVTSLLLALLALSLALVVACGGDDEDEAASAAATMTSGARLSEIQDIKFESPMKVAAGSEVTWVNKDGVPHNVIGKGDSFKSGKLDKDDTFKHIFETAGRFEFTCTFHAGMNGVVEVQ